MVSKWNYVPLTEEEKHIERKLAETLSISPAICTLLVQRGVKTEEQAKKFFRPQLSDLYDPFLLKDMDKAVARLNKAMGAKEKILVYGDYDVDGTTAVALVYKFIISPIVMMRDTVFPRKVSIMRPITVSRWLLRSIAGLKPSRK